MPTFFRLPLNMDNRNINLDNSDAVVNEVSDNNYTTSLDFNAVTRVQCNIDTTGDGTGSPQTYTHIYVKCNNIAAYTIGPITRRFKMPNDEDAEYDEAEEKLTNVGIFQHSLYKLQSSSESRTVTIRFIPRTGQQGRVYQILILKEELEMDSDGFSEVDPASEDRTSGVHVALDGTETRWRSFATRPKREVVYAKPIIEGITELENPPDDDGNYVPPTSPREFLNKIELFRWQYPNFVFSYDYSNNIEVPNIPAWQPNTTAEYVEYNGFYYRNNGNTALVIDGHAQTVNPLQDTNKWELIRVPTGRLSDVLPERDPPLWRTINKVSYPEHVYIGHIVEEKIATPYFSQVKETGYLFNFTIREN